MSWARTFPILVKVCDDEYWIPASKEDDRYFIKYRCSITIMIILCSRYWPVFHQLIQYRYFASVFLRIPEYGMYRQRYRSCLRTAGQSSPSAVPLYRSMYAQLFAVRGTEYWVWCVHYAIFMLNRYFYSSTSNAMSSSVRADPR